MGKVTMQDIASSVGVSRISVWKALSNRPGVSDELRQQIIDAAAQMGYTPTQAQATKDTEKERTVSVVVSRPESSSFWMQIIHHIAKELSKFNISLRYTYMPTAYRSGYTLPSSLNSDLVSGFIVLNIYDERLLKMLAALPLPKVFLDTVPSLHPNQLNGDLVLLEGRSCIREITGRLLTKNLTTLGFMGDVNYAQTNHDRYLGFLDAHELEGIAPRKEFSFTGPISLRSHYQEISSFLDGLTILPDGFICASDFIAHYAQQYLLDSQRKMPENFTLTGFDNSFEYQNVAGKITTVDVQTASLGKRLAQKIMFRADHPDASTEVSYIGSDILYRGTLE